MTSPSINEPFKELEEALSLERFGRYLAWAGGDRGKAVELYTLNTKISESLYIPLQMLEVSLRNRIHRVLTEMLGESWMLDETNLLGDHQPRQLKEAIAEIERAGKEALPARVVAALSLSFWTAMLGKVYENRWREGLYNIARRNDGKNLARKDLATPLMRIRELRNRIAHHEPVIYWDLHKTNDQLIQLTEWLSPAAAKWCTEHSRFAHICPKELHTEIKKMR